MRSEDVDEGVAAELLAHGPRELPRDCSLGDDRECVDRLHVAALDERFAGLAGGEIDRAKRSHERGQRLHRRSDRRPAPRS